MTAPTATTSSPRIRIESVDIVRGIIMLIMALDHTREYFGPLGQSPTNLATTTTALFFTRWITHFCAPVFFFLTGTGAFLSLQKKSTGELSKFLFTRGLWLIFAEAVIARFAYQFNFDYKITLLLTLWALGWAMIVLSGLVHLPAWCAGVFGLVLIGGHNLLDGISIDTWWWTMLHTPGFLLNEPGRIVMSLYPLIPWVGVTAVGYALGQVYRWERARRRDFLLKVGLAVCVGFLVLRGINIYGDPRPWSAQASSMFTLLSFLNTTKQAPSLLFLMMTLGPALLLLRTFDHWTPSVVKPALVVGRVPLFYYLVHFALIHLLTVIYADVQFGSARGMATSPDLEHFPFTPPDGWGLSLGMIYLAWFSVLLIMYPLSLWYGNLKRRKSWWWLSYV